MNREKILGFALGPLGSAVLGIFSLPVLAWLFSSEDVGRITMLQVFSGLSVVVFTLGLDLAYVRGYHESNNKHGLLKTAFLPGFCFISLTFLVSISVSPMFLSGLFFSIQDAFFSVLIALCFIAVFVLRYISLILRVQERGLAYSMSQICPKFFFLLIIFSNFICNENLGFKDLLFAHTVSVLLAVLVFLVVAYPDMCLAFKARLDGGFRSLFSFGLPLVFAGLASWSMTAMDKIFLRSVSDFGELGLYFIAVSVAAAVGVVTSIFNTIWAPMVFRWTSEGADPQKIDLVCEHMAAVVFFLFVISGGFSGVIPYFFPDDYSSIQYMITACMAAPLLYALSESTGIGLSISRRSSLSMLASCLAVAVSAVTNYLLVPRYGAQGAAAATAITFWFFLLVRTEFSCLAWRSFPKYKIYIGSTLTSAAAATVCLWGEEFGALSLLVWFLIGLIGCIIYNNSLRSAPSFFFQVILKKKASV